MRLATAHATSALSHFNNNFKQEHWKAAEMLLGYLPGTISQFLVFYRTGEKIAACIDSYWASDEQNCGSYSGYVLKFGGAAVCWKLRKQKAVALLSTEIEYMAMG
jgi:hypothetical protein